MSNAFVLFLFSCQLSTHTVFNRMAYITVGYKLTASMYFPFTPLLLKSNISFTGSQFELHIFLHEIRHL